MRDFHEKDSAGSRVRILRTIMRQRAEEGTNIEHHVQKVTELFQKLLSFDKEVQIEFLMSATLLGSLPSSYDSLITALEARREDELTSSFVRSKVVEEYRRRMEREVGNTESSALKISTNHSKQNSIVCNFCDKPGHIRKHCRKLADQTKNKKSNGSHNNANLISAPTNDVLFAVGKMSGWIIDSGATCHISREKSSFLELDMSHREKVCVADRNEVVSSGKE